MANELFEDISTAFKVAIYERAKTPVFLTYLGVLFIWHFKAFILLLSVGSSTSVEAKWALLESVYSSDLCFWAWNTLVPLVIAVALTVIFPLLHWVMVWPLEFLSEKAKLSRISARSEDTITRDEHNQMMSRLNAVNSEYMQKLNTAYETSNRIQGSYLDIKETLDCLTKFYAEEGEKTKGEGKVPSMTIRDLDLLKEVLDAIVVQRKSTTVLLHEVESSLSSELVQYWNETGKKKLKARRYISLFTPGRNEDRISITKKGEALGNLYKEVPEAFSILER